MQWDDSGFYPGGDSSDFGTGSWSPSDYAGFDLGGGFQMPQQTPFSFGGDMQLQGPGGYQAPSPMSAPGAAGPAFNFNYGGTPSAPLQDPTQSMGGAGGGALANILGAVGGAPGALGLAGGLAGIIGKLASGGVTGAAGPVQTPPRRAPRRP